MAEISLGKTVDATPIGALASANHSPFWLAEEKEMVAVGMPVSRLPAQIHTLGLWSRDGSDISLR
jgi:hypothetical protein